MACGLGCGGWAERASERAGGPWRRQAGSARADQEPTGAPLQVQHAAFVAFYLDMAKGTALGQLVAGMVRKAERARSALTVQPQAGDAAAAAADEPVKAAVLAALSSNTMPAPATVALDPPPSGKLPKPVCSGAAQPLAAAQRASRLLPPSNR